MNSNFVDHVIIYFKSGAGGNGAVAWRKEKYVPQGGPEGGDGGAGGSVILKGDAQLWTLLDLKYRKHIKAEKGQNGSSACKTGKSGKDEILKVPLGTVARDAETGEIIGEITEHKQKLVLLEGGHGGKGNWHFRNSRNQAPTYAAPGGPAKEQTVTIELKLLADVGLVGFPNAGKSTLLSVITAAKPKIGAYPFTTLKPNLGIVKYRDYKSFVVADIPGIIEGASEGKGLGFTFLRHIERNSVLLFLIPADSPDPRNEYETLLNELRVYNKELLDKDRVIAISKSDLIPDKKAKNKIEKAFKGLEHVFISAVTQTGLVELKDILWKLINQSLEVTPDEKEDWE